MATDDDLLLRGRSATPHRPSPGEIGGDSGTAAKPRSGEPVNPAMLFRRPGPPKPDGAESDAAEPEDFEPESTDYKADGRANRSVPALRFILKDLTEYGFQYAHLDTAYPGGCEFIPSEAGKGNVIKLRFAGQACTPFVILAGIRLRRIWADIMAHRTLWIRELPTGVNFERGQDPVIESISFPPAPAIVVPSGRK